MLSGKQWKQSLNDGRKIWINGEEIKSAVECPVLKPTIETVSALIDLHKDSEFSGLLTETDKAGNVYPACYKLPKSSTDLTRLGKIHERLALETLGQMARLYNYTAAYVCGLYENRKDLAPTGHPIVEVIERFYEKFKKEFTQATIAFADPPSVRGPGGKQDVLSVVEKRKDGIVVSGVKTLATGAPYANEILILKLAPRSLLEMTPPENILSFFVEPGTKGLTLLCREGLADQERKESKNPLAAFDEIDACLVFENVFIPNDRILYSGDLEIADRINKIVGDFSRHPHCRRMETKFGLFWQLAQSMAHVLGTAWVQQSHDAIFTIGRHYLMVSRLVRDAEQTPYGSSSFPRGCRPDLASLNLAINYGIDHYQETVNMLELIGGQASVLIPTHSDLDSKLIGPIYQRVFKTSEISVTKKADLLRLAGGLTGSRFATRQSLLEYYALGGAKAVRGALEINLTDIFNEAENKIWKNSPFNNKK